ncbi:MAG: hypothetical protein O9282_13135 [Flavobacterium sp.]|jgi:hypothetical protein|uniref:hypothetical protein n=1 Tax=Flavobacterium sp. TaxID=239 RepID=UPI0022BDCBCC|nr:hypothetical protein [Flavobacterium sp.]MCZ8091344.1 hypothetical protein [Flavobacterium sp.]MCZ8332249.1 hypothetical protein [Flavobacterium sp.]
MKKIFFIVSLVLFCFQSYANNGLERNNEIYNSSIKNLSVNQNIDLEMISELKFDKVENYSIVISKNNNEVVYDCEITIKGNFEGNQVDVVVTIYDVSWAGCQTLKAAVKVLLATM